MMVVVVVTSAVGRRGSGGLRIRGNGAEASNEEADCNEGFHGFVSRKVFVACC